MMHRRGRPAKARLCPRGRALSRRSERFGRNIRPGGRTALARTGDRRPCSGTVTASENRPLPGLLHQDRTALTPAKGRMGAEGEFAT